jgi:outer membrane protein TolC
MKARRTPSLQPSARVVGSAVAMALTLSGCASGVLQPPLDQAQAVARAQLGSTATVQWLRTEDERSQARARVEALLQQPLTAAAAVELALLNNAGLQVQLAELGITQAEVLQAGRLPNPGFTFGRSSEGDKREIERGIHINLARLLVLPWLRDLEQRRLSQAERTAALQVMALITQVRRAQVDAVAARERSRYMADVLKAAQASAELARRMAQVGNFNKLQQAREQSFQADAVQGYARALREEMATRERLGGEPGAPAVRSGHGASGACAGALHTSHQPYRTDGGQCAVRSARGLWALARHARHCQTPAR